jgi:hypothetical protein
MRFAAVAVTAAAFLGAAQAHAQTCSQLIDQMKAASDSGLGTYLSISSSQANKITTSSGVGLSSAVLFWNIDRMTSGIGYDGRFQFNDRNNSGYVNGASQNFSMLSQSTEAFQVWIVKEGTNARASIRNRVWGNYLDIPLTCSNGIMYGFGTAIGNANGALPAMYVFSFFTDGVLN